MMGTMTSVASLTICLVMTTTSAFVVRAPKVNPPDPASGKRASASPVGGPLGVGGGKMGAGGALSRGSGNSDKEAKKAALPRVPSAEGYVGLRSRSTSPLHAFKGVQPEITEDGNATVPIVEGVGGEEGGDSGVASAHQDNTAVRYRVTVAVEELSSHQHFFGDDMSIAVIASAAHESASTTQQERGVSDDADITKDEHLPTDMEIAADVSITTDTDVATDADLTAADDLKLCEDSSDAINDEGRGVMSDDTALDKELPFELTADGVASVVSIGSEGEFDDATGPVSHDIDAGALSEELSFDLADNSGIDEARTQPLGPEIPEHAVDDVMGSVAFDDNSDGPVSKVALFDGGMDDLVISMLHDALTRGFSDSDPLVLDGFVDRLMWSKLRDAISGQATSELADAFDDMVTSLLHHAFFGPAASKAVLALAKTDDDRQLVVDSYILAVADYYDQFKEARYRRATGWAPADAVAGEAGPTSGGAVDDAAGSVPHDTDGSTLDEELPAGRAAGDLTKGTGIWPFDPGMKEYASADEFTPVLHDNGDWAFYDNLRFALGARGLIKEIRSIWPFNPEMDEKMEGDEDFDVEFLFTLDHTENRAFYKELRFALDAYRHADEMMGTWLYDVGMAEHAGGYGFMSALYAGTSDREVSKPVDLGKSVNELVLAVVRDALTRWSVPKRPIIDAIMDNVMWSKLRKAISGKARPESGNIADSLDSVVTCLLHDAFFGPEASAAVSSMAETADDSQLVVDDYVRAVAELYENFKEATDLDPDIKARIFRKAGKGLGILIKKFWRRFRRKKP